MSRELDEACAKAMGWAPVKLSNRALWQHPTVVGWRQVKPPRFSTDAAFIPKTLAFLHAEWPWLNIDTYPTEQGRGVTVQGKNDCGDKTPIAEGDTLSEALAKLVVAVGDAKRSAE